MKKTALVDLDGVLADYSQGFKGIENIGDPIPGAVEFTKTLSTFARVVIYTTRCKAYPEGASGPDGVPEPNHSEPDHLVAVVRAWLDKHGFSYDEIYSGQGKPFAACIIDDRAICCRPQSPYVSQLDPNDPTPFEAAVMAARNFCGVS